MKTSSKRKRRVRSVFDVYKPNSERLVLALDAKSNKEKSSNLDSEKNDESDYVWESSLPGGPAVKVKKDKKDSMDDRSCWI